MRCRLARRLIQELLNGELTDSRQDQLNAHLTQCATCRAEQTALRTLRPLLGELSTHEPPTAYWRDLNRTVLCQLAESTGSRQAAEPRRWFRQVVWAGAVSMCTFAMGLYVGFVMFGGRASAGDMRVATRPPTPVARERARVSERVQRTPEVPPRPREVKFAATYVSPKKSRTPSSARPRLEPQDRASDPIAQLNTKSAKHIFAVYRLAPPTLGVTSGEFSTHEAALPRGTIVTPVAQRLIVPLRTATMETLVPLTTNATLRESAKREVERTEFR